MTAPTNEPQRSQSSGGVISSSTFAWIDIVGPWIDICKAPGSLRLPTHAGQRASGGETQGGNSDAAAEIGSCALAISRASMPLQVAISKCAVPNPPRDFPLKFFHKKAAVVSARRTRSRGTVDTFQKPLPRSPLRLGDRREAAWRTPRATADRYKSSRADFLMVERATLSLCDMRDTPSRSHLRPLRTDSETPHLSSELC